MGQKRIRGWDGWLLMHLAAKPGDRWTFDKQCDLRSRSVGPTSRRQQCVRSRAPGPQWGVDTSRDRKPAVTESRPSDGIQMRDSMATALRAAEKSQHGVLRLPSRTGPTLATPLRRPARRENCWCGGDHCAAGHGFGRRKLGTVTSWEPIIATSTMVTARSRPRNRISRIETRPMRTAEVKKG